MTECPSEVNFFLGGNKISLRILTKANYIKTSSIFGANTAYLLRKVQLYIDGNNSGVMYCMAILQG